MISFGLFSAYYDLLYEDKDYGAECNYVDYLIKSYHPGAASLLDLGCGTGKHVSLFTEIGYRVVGVDSSESMISFARMNNEKLAFIEGDARTIRLEDKFDAVTSLFHVMSYQTSNEDLNQVFQTANHHLSKNGIFLFDCWYGPGVLTDPPTVRVKRMENEKIRVQRIAESLVFPNENRVDVNYEIQVYDKKNPSHPPAILKEVHSMRYLFLPELKMLSNAAGFEIVDCKEWMKMYEPGLGSWNAVMVCKKK